mmetsp:Transcript_30025/g.48159  ORF Transcript_30025/g.48159 Transcript_30025/m.48159 type:complete len:206 (+) Transcript_30025:71-688(+)
MCFTPLSVGPVKERSSRWRTSGRRIQTWCPPFGRQSCCSQLPGGGQMRTQVVGASGHAIARLARACLAALSRAAREAHAGYAPAHHTRTVLRRVEAELQRHALLPHSHPRTGKEAKTRSRSGGQILLSTPSSCVGSAAASRRAKWWPGSEHKRLGEASAQMQHRSGLDSLRTRAEAPRPHCAGAWPHGREAKAAKPFGWCAQDSP